MEQNGTTFMTVTTRADTCSSVVASDVIGDRLVINEVGGANFSVPLLEEDAQLAKFTRGSCLDTMGRHWMLDLETAPKLSFEADNLMPLVPMYWEGKINAMFFTVPFIEQSIFNSNWW